MSNHETSEITNGIAIIGMSGRFPQAKNIAKFWQNLRDGLESITFFAEQDLVSAGLDPALLKYPNYVNAGVILEDLEMFDASFFGFSPREAEILDPQQRIFLECAWEALEDSGYVPEIYEGLIGVYAGVNSSHYLFNLYSNREIVETMGGFQIALGNDKDHVTTRVSYKLNLKGPAVTVQTTCSTSLVAVCQACQSLLNYQCDIALAGGSSIILPQNTGYIYQEGGIYSADGHCRAFDAKAEGTIGGSGVGIAVLKRLEEALADGDYIHAVIRGFAVNNDGSEKVGYTAPSVDGQAEVIVMAQAMAGIDPETITYIEAHGTATPMGDPIEVAALTKAFRASTEKKGFCALGSVKTNIGHLDPAAGIAGLIKTVLALKHKMLPSSLHFEEPNPKIDFANTPFYVVNKLLEWKHDGTRRRAGVSSFGIGGTNAHVVLEEATPKKDSARARDWHLFLLSTRSARSLDSTTINLGNHLRQNPHLNPADVAYTLQIGRKAFNYRRMVLHHDGDNDHMMRALETLDANSMYSAVLEKNRPISFMFSGQGTQYVDMGLDVYQSEPTFRENIDLCADILKSHIGIDLREVLYPDQERKAMANEKLSKTDITQPALFAVEYALARLWQEWGVHPESMVGHSIGEYVAACLSGVFSLEDGLALVAARGRLMQQLPEGAMLAVHLPERDVKAFLNSGLSLAAVNGPSLCTVSGTHNDIANLQTKFDKAGIMHRYLHTSHAFHSHMMDPILELFTDEVKKINCNSFKIPFLSNVTGTWITEEEARQPSYWTKHIRQTVRFNDNLLELLKQPERILLEIGPGRTLCILASQSMGKSNGQISLSSLPNSQDRQADMEYLLTTLGRLWLAGTEIDWAGFYAQEQRHRVPLPTYPFERQRYWIGHTQQPKEVGAHEEPAIRAREIADWFYIPTWRPSVTTELPLEGEWKKTRSSWLIFNDGSNLGMQLVKKLMENGQKITTVLTGEKFAQIDAHTYTICPRRPQDYEALLKNINQQAKVIDTIIHLWSIIPVSYKLSGVEFFAQCQCLGFYSLLFLVQALEKRNFTNSIQIGIVSDQIQPVFGDELLDAAKATVLGPCKVVPQEYPNLKCRSIDIAVDKLKNTNEEKLVDRIIAELTVEPFHAAVAYRNGRRWVQTFEPFRLEKATKEPSFLRKGGVYLITGGLGNIGLALAEELAQTVQVKLVLTGRSAFPERNEWDDWLAIHGEDEVGRKIRNLHALEKYGAEVQVFSADAADREQMHQVIEQILEKFGKLNGVIHAAGNSAALAASAINQTDQSKCEQHFRPKVNGLIVLEELLRGKELDFYLLLSSLSSVLGGIGFAAYSAANIFMDTIASRMNQAKSTLWISVNWDGWLFQATEDTSETGLLGMNDFILPQEGVEAFRRILDRLPQQIVVSVSDLDTRLRKWINLESLREMQQSKKESPTTMHARPELTSQYVAPRNELEQSIAEVWQQMLGVAPIGIHDNFFELGGHSLLAIQLISRLQETLNIEVTVHQLFEAPTLAELTEGIEKDRREVEEDAGVTARLVDLVESLSENQVREMLEKKEGDLTAG